MNSSPRREPVGPEKSRCIAAGQRRTARIERARRTPGRRRISPDDCAASLARRARKSACKRSAWKAQRPTRRTLLDSGNSRNVALRGTRRSRPKIRICRPVHHTRFLEATCEQGHIPRIRGKSAGRRLRRGRRAKVGARSGARVAPAPVRRPGARRPGRDVAVGGRPDAPPVPSDTFELAPQVVHAERYGSDGATYWVARRNAAGAQPA
jgi:hypothetical protein